jgi:ABC-type nitrate/sulfonate/bicarbonate transport system permease component
MPSAVFLAAFAAFWPLLIQTYYGMHDVDPVTVDTARSFGLGRLARLRRVELPSAVGFIATGLRISLTVALILVVTAQLVIGVPGLGKDISIAQAGGDVPATYALVIATGILGWILNTAASAGERRLLRWHPSQRRLP